VGVATVMTAALLTMKRMAIFMQRTFDPARNKLGAALEEFCDILISESRQNENGIPLEKIRNSLNESGRIRG
jgi:hypothetical protein